MTNLLATVLIIAAESLGCLLAADFLAGLLHWAEDTWLARGMHPLVDRLIVEPNIDHHQRPGGIRLGTYWETNGVTMGIAGVFAVAFLLASVHAWQVWLIVAIASQSNQIHAWAHTSNPPRAIAWLQRACILQSARHHAVHHKRPYAVRYCTTTPLLNPVLDGIGFWRALERIGEAFGAKVQRLTPARGGY